MSSKVLLLNKNSSWGVQVDARGNSTYDNVLSFASNELKEKYIIYTLYDKNETRSLNDLIEQEGINVKFSQIDAANFRFSIDNTNWEDRNKLLNKDFAILKENNNIFYLTILSANKNVSKIDFTAKLDVFLQYDIKNLFKDDNAIINQAHFKIETLEDITNEQFDTSDKNYILRTSNMQKARDLNITGNASSITKFLFPLYLLRSSIELIYFDKDLDWMQFDIYKVWTKWKSYWKLYKSTAFSDIGVLAFLGNNESWENGWDIKFEFEISGYKYPFKTWLESKSLCYGTWPLENKNVNTILDAKNLDGATNVIYNMFNFFYRLKEITKCSFILNEDSSNKQLTFIIKMDKERNKNISIFSNNLDMVNEIEHIHRSTPNNVFAAFYLINLDEIFKEEDLEVEFGLSDYYLQDTSIDRFEKWDVKKDIKLITSQFIDRKYSMLNASIIKNEDTDILEDKKIICKAAFINVPNIEKNALSLIPYNDISESERDKYDISTNIADNRYINIKINDGILVKSDKLAEYLQLNKNKDEILMRNNATNAFLGVMGGAIGVGAGLATGNMFAAGASALGGVSTLTKSIQNIQANVAMKKDLKNNPELRTKNSTDSFVSSLGYITPQISLMSVYPDIRNMLNSHFYRFGYNAANRYDKLNKYLDTRYWFNYIQASNIYELINKDIAYNLKQEIAMNIEKGLTINHIRKEDDFDYIKINQDLFNPFTK